ncbi:uncharacterized protein LDX57_004088 [Aspergillus melleus]|uniref:uncharacterized protein n=1 Tax=Aspergillus melleus TaxID=138277 RepID=UPI001E8DD126|nr:uncharacterized protein LDX57_004088 [Aspergillus melleus]KAH8426345.1 hypothetical protein LDX57_004088 [Aspergillus melleus]
MAMGFSNEVVSPGEYEAARRELLKEEKAATQLLQRLATSRRQLPMVEVNEPARFKFDAMDGEKGLPDLFEDRKQLIVYHFMLGPEDSQGCIGCTLCMDHIPDLRHLWSRNTSFAAVATAPISQITEYANRMGWQFPFYSAAKTHKAWHEAEVKGETITWKPGNGYFGLSVFLKDGERVYHTYDTTNRGMEIILSTYHLLDMTPLGRQEVGNGMGEFRRRDEY